MPSIIQTLMNTLSQGGVTQLNLAGDASLLDGTVSSGLTLLNLEQPTAAAQVIDIIDETASKDFMAGSSGVAIIDMGASNQFSQLLKKANVDLFRNYAKYSTWVRAAIDYHRRMLGRAKYEIIQLDNQVKPNRRDKTVKAEVERLLRDPNEAGESYGLLKEKMIEDYLVVGHGFAELGLNSDLTAHSITVIDAAVIGFVKSWDGRTPGVPRFCEFTNKNANTVKRYLANEQSFCMVNRPMSDTKVGFSHVEALHRSVMALLSGDEFLIKQLLQPVPESLINLGEGVTQTQVDSFKYQMQTVRDKLAVIGGAKGAQVIKLTGSAEEMRILDGQEWFVRQVAAIFGMSTAKLKLSVDTSRANTESMNDEDLEAITGELARIEELESATFINRFNFMGEVNLQFTYPIMHRKDELQQARIARIGTGTGWVSVNEARTNTGARPYEGNEYKYIDEPIINTKDGPLPLSVWEKKVEDYEKNIGKAPAVPATGESGGTSADSGDGGGDGSTVDDGDPGETGSGDGETDKE